jgi:hypothetical protein
MTAGLPLAKELIEDAIREPAAIEDAGGPADAVIRAGGRRFLVEMKSDSRSASVASAISHLEAYRASYVNGIEELLPVLVVRHMGHAGADLCRQRGVNWLDFDGNADIEAPDLRIRIIGQRNRRRAQPQQGVNPFAAKASRVVHVLLLEPRKRWTRAELQSATDLDKGSISRTLGALQTGGYLKPDSSARSVVTVSDPRTLLDAWAEHYRARPAAAYGLLSTRDGRQTEARVHEILDAHNATVLFGGLSAAAVYTNFGSFRRVRVYLEADLRRDIRDEINVSGDPRGRNVVLVVDDGGAKIGSETRSGRRYTSPILSYLDLQSEGERAEEAREELRRVIEAKWK